MSESRTYAIILAAGRGERMQVGKNKMLLEIGGLSLLEHCLERFHDNIDIDYIFTVIAPEDMHSERDSHVRQRNILMNKYPRLKAFVAGGKTRQASVFNGLQAIKSHASAFSGRIQVLIHDGARCFIPVAVIGRVLSKLNSERCGVVAAMPVTDTIRKTEHSILKELDVPRENLIEMQTPQAADLDILLHAFELASREKIGATDDISLLLRIGYPVRVVPGDSRNLKLTIRADYEKARLLYEAGYFKK